MFVRVCTVFVSLTVFVFLFIACDSCIVWTTCQYVTEINIIMYASMRYIDRPHHATPPHSTPLATPQVSIVNVELYSVNCGLLSCFWNFVY